MAECFEGVCEALNVACAIIEEEETHRCVGNTAV